MQTERIISNTKVMIAILILEDIFIFSVANYILNFFIKIPDVIKDLDNPGKYIGIRYIFPSLNNLANHTSLFWAAYIILLIFCLIINGVSAYKIKTSMAEEYINVGNKGNERWTTNEEIKQQYKEIPDRDVPFEGSGGMIVSRMGDKLYIDQSAVNNLIIGITRSRKGETLVFPSIDVYSRAKEKASLVVIDPKLEGYKSSKKTLEKRGYEVRLLNLADPLHSMGFNPLAEIVQAYLNKDEAGAELLTQAFAFTIFNPSKPTCDGDTFWKDTPSSLLSALILAHVEDCVRADEMLNEKRRNIFNEKREAFDKLSDELKEKARTVYADEKSKNENVINNIKIKYLPPEEPFTKENKNIKKINMYSILNLFTELVRIVDEENADISALDTYFTKRPMLNRAKLKYAGIEMAGYRTKTSIFASMFAKLTIFTYENVAKMTAESSIKLEDVGFGEKPIDKRPKDILTREEYGHWEMDSVVGPQGKSSACLLVLTERKTRNKIIEKVKDHTSDEVVRVLDKIERKLGEKVFREKFKTITVDNGTEFSDWEGMERSRRNKKNRTEIFYCHPYRSCERGSNENNNKLIRRWYPKGESFDNVSREEIKKVEDWINSYPRLLFNWQSSDDMARQELSRRECM